MLVDTGKRKIDKIGTKKEVERILDHFRKCRRAIESEKLYGVNEYSDGLINGIPREEAIQLVGRLEHAIDGLTTIQGDLIRERYILSRDGEYEYVVKDRIQVAERTYYRIKHEALLGLAEALGIEVYKCRK